MKASCLRIKRLWSNVGVLQVVGGVVLEVAGGLDDGQVVASFGYELNADGEMSGGEAGGDAQGRQATEIADGA